MTTVTDVARRAKVSVSTVSRVLSGKNIVAKRTRGKVLKAIEELGFQPNSLAQGLRRGRSNTVGFMVGDIEQTVYPQLSKHLQASLEECGLDLLLFNTNHSTGRFKTMLEHARKLRLSSIIVATSDEIDATILTQFQATEAGRDCPIIVLGQNLTALGVCSVWHDDTAASRMATKHLLSIGCKRIAYVGRIGGSAIGTMRFQGYRQAIEEQWGSVDASLVWDSAYRYPAGYSSMRKIAENNIAVDGVIAGSDELALGVMAAAADLGMAIPSDLNVIGFGNVEWSAHVRPTLSTLSSDFPLMAETVKRIIESGNDMVDCGTVIERKLILRNSVRQ